MQWRAQYRSCALEFDAVVMNNKRCDGDLVTTGRFWLDIKWESSPIHVL